MINTLNVLGISIPINICNICWATQMCFLSLYSFGIIYSDGNYKIWPTFADISVSIMYLYFGWGVFIAYDGLTNTHFWQGIPLNKWPINVGENSKQLGWERAIRFCQTPSAGQTWELTSLSCGNKKKKKNDPHPNSHRRGWGRDLKFCMQP